MKQKWYGFVEILAVIKLVYYDEIYHHLFTCYHCFVIHVHVYICDSFVTSAMNDPQIGAILVTLVCSS